MDHAPEAPLPVPASLTDTATGLSTAEADERLRRFGPNRLPGDASSHPLTILFAQFRSPLVLILVAAALISFGVGEVSEGLIISVIVLASSGLGFYQEFRASNAVRDLRARLAITVAVRRDGRSMRLPMSQIVAGDVLELTGGSLVGADALVVEATELQVDEAVITGESFPIEKSPAGDAAATSANLVYMGTSVRSGTARAVVLSTGAGTQFGRIAALAGGQEPETGFARGIRRFGVLMTQIMLVIVAVILPINVILGRPLLESVLFSAALAVGLTPELLPAIVTVTLARGAQQLAKAGVLVRRLVAIENLGAMNVLCTDKTGTLTLGAIRLTAACDVDGNPAEEVRRWALLNATLQRGLPNPLDDAIVSAEPHLPIDGYRSAGEVPYDFERKRLSVLVSRDRKTTLVCKGAADSVLGTCTQVHSADGAAVPLGPERRAAEQRRLQAWGEEGQRVLAVAVRDMTGRDACERADEQGLTLIGYLLFADELKPDIAEVVADLHRAGIGLKMITGDNRHVAAHVAREIGLRTDRLLTGADLGGLGDRALAHRIGRTDVFAEITPDQKERIVAALRRQRHIVGYMGDGINDAPALRASDVGISVDTAVEAARDAADVVLLKQDLRVLHDGVLLGRASFANTLKYIFITTSSNLGNMISMAAMSLFLPFLPMLAKQILVNNLLSDLPMMAISGDRVDEELLARAGRWDFRTLLRSMIAFGLVSSAFDALTFCVLLFVFRADEPTFQTTWFIVSLLTELAIIAVMRTRKPFYRSLPAPLLVWSAAAVALAALVLPYTPVAAALGFVPLPLAVLIGGVLIVLGYVAASEALKLRFYHARGRGRPRVRHFMH